MAASRRDGLSILIVILIGVVAVLLWMFLQEPEVVVVSDPAGAEGAEGADADAPGADAGMSAEAGSLSGRGTETGAAPPPLEAPPPPDTSATHLLRGGVRSAAGAAIDGVTITVNALRQYGWLDSKTPPIVGSAADDGAYELDISALFQAKKPPTQVRVAFDHPRHMPVHVKLVVEEGRRDEATGARVLEADASLARAILIDGVVRDLSEAPMAEVRMRLLLPSKAGFVLTDVGEPLVLDGVTTGADGTFRLRAPSPGTYLVAALSKRHLPEGARVRVDWERAPERLVMALTEGRTVRGQVLLNGRPLAGVRVEADKQPVPKPAYQLDFQWIHLEGGRLRPGEVATTTDEEGRFELAGLDAGERRVAPSWGGGTRIWPELLRAAGRTVEAGSQDVVLDVGGVPVEVRPVSGGVLVEKADVVISINDNEALRARTPAEDGCRFVLPPDRTFELEVTHAGFEPLVRELRTGPTGVPMLETVELGAPKPQATLVVTLEDDGGKPITRADIQVVDPSSSTSHGFDMSPVRSSEDGVYRIEHLEPGKRAIVVRPGRSSMEFFGHFLVIREDVLLEVRKETRLELVARRGGRLRLAVHDEQGNLLGCSAVIRDARGESLHVSYVTGGDDFATMSTGGPGSASITTVEPPLEPGEYEVELSLKGHETKRVPAKIEPGKTTDVDVTLRKL